MAKKAAPKLAKNNTSGKVDLAEALEGAVVVDARLQREGVFINPKGDRHQIDKELMTSFPLDKIAEINWRMTDALSKSGKNDLLETPMYLLHSTEKLQVWVDDKSMLDMSREDSGCDLFSYCDEPEAPVRVFMINSTAKVRRFKMSDNGNTNQVLLIDIDAEVDTISSSVIAGKPRYHSNVKLKSSYVHDSNLWLNEFFNEVNGIMESDIIDSAVNGPCYIRNCDIVDSNIRTDKYTALRSLNMMRCNINCNSIDAGVDGRRSWERMPIIDVSIYQLDDNIRLTRAFELGTTCGGMASHSLQFYPVRHNDEHKDRLRVVRNGRFSEDYELSPKPLTIDFDATRQEIRSAIRGYLFPKLEKAKDQMFPTPIGAIEDSIIAEATAVIHARLRIIKQTRLAASL